MNSRDVDVFEKLKGQLAQLSNEVSALSKKSPDGPINSFKLRFINEKLEEANSLLRDQHKPFRDFERFDEAALPTNSDVLLILSQYLDSLEGWRCANLKHVDYNWYWDVDDKASIPASPPTRYRRKN